jgi:5-methylcytosine-specific restriction endonuclease McrA
MDHHINETELVSRKVTKHKFRKSIIEEWDSRCYICGEQFDNITLDHLVPKRAGGYTSRSNLAPCCALHNRQKGHQQLWEFWTNHDSWDLGRAIKLLSYLRRCDKIPAPDDKIS